MSDELETRIEYGHVMPEPVGWVGEYRGIKYASHQRTVHFRVDEPVAIDHWTYADHRHPVEGCEVCEQLAAHGQRPVTTREAVESRLGSGVAGNPEERVVARLTVERFIDDDGADLVRVDSDDMNGGRVAVVEALGLLQLAIYDISNHEGGDE